MQSIYSELRDNLFAVVDYPESLRQTIGDATPWRSFCSLPDEVKKGFSFGDFTKDTDAGYTLRKKKSGRENKEYYHFDGAKRHQQYIDRYQVDALFTKYKEVSDFLTYANAVYEEAIVLLKNVVRQTDKDIPMLFDRLHGNDGEVIATLRFLHYPSTKEEETLAAPHYDQGGYTLHLFETHQGLQYLDWNYKWHTVPIEEGKTVVFSGYKLEKFTQGSCQKTWHRVVQLPHVTDGNKARLSMVLFCGISGVEGYDRSERSQHDTPYYAKVSV